MMWDVGDAGAWSNTMCLNDECKSQEPYMLEGPGEIPPGWATSWSATGMKTYGNGKCIICNTGKNLQDYLIKPALIALAEKRLDAKRRTQRSEV